jgi:hypothetical protein
MLQEARIFANFKHFCDVEFASGKCPHLAIRDRSNLRGDGGATSLLHSRDLRDAQSPHAEKVVPLHASAWQRISRPISNNANVNPTI